MWYRVLALAFCPVLAAAQDYRVLSVNGDGTAFGFETTYRQIGSRQSGQMKMFRFDGAGPHLVSDAGGHTFAMSGDGTAFLLHRGSRWFLTTPQGTLEAPGLAGLSRNGRFAVVLRPDGRACRVELASGAEHCLEAAAPPWIVENRIADNGAMLALAGNEWRLIEADGGSRRIRSALECEFAQLDPSGRSVLCSGRAGQPLRWHAIDLATGAARFLAPEGVAVPLVSTSEDGERWALWLLDSNLRSSLALEWRDGSGRFELPAPPLVTALHLSGNGGLLYYSTATAIRTLDWHSHEERAVLESPRGAALADGWPVPGGWIYTWGDQPPAGAELRVGSRLAPRLRGAPRPGWQIPWEAAEDGPGMPIVLRFGDPHFEASGGATLGEFEPQSMAVLVSAGRSPVPLSFAWHSDALTPVTAASPAARGEIVYTLWRGLGPVNPRPAPGEPAPGEPAARVTTPVSLRDRLLGSEVEVVSAAMRPGFAGEYLVGLRIPDGFPAATLNLELLIAGRQAACGPIPIRVSPE